MFEDRIQTLEAQLARRDAELETHVGHLVLEANAAPRILMQNEKRSRKEPVSMAQEEVMIILQRTSARNKTLEEEIKGLFKRVCIFGHLVCFAVSFRMSSSSNKYASRSQLHRRHYRFPLSHLRHLLIPNCELKPALFKLLTLNLIHFLRSPNH